VHGELSFGSPLLWAASVEADFEASVMSEGAEKTAKDYFLKCQK
jgi:hypothetical protein